MADKEKIDEKIEKMLKALNGTDTALATHTHHINMAAVTGLEALGYDDNGRLKFGRFDKTTDGKEGDGAKTVAEAANKYLNGILENRINSALGEGGRFSSKKLAPDELARLQSGGYFGISSQDIYEAAGQMKANFTPEALKKAFDKQIGQTQGVIKRTNLTLANDLERDKVLSYVGLDKGELKGSVNKDEVKPAHLLSLLDVYRKEKAIDKSTLEQLGIYKK